MDYTDDDAIAQFRLGLRAWLDNYQQTHDLNFDPADFESVRRWHRDLAAAGFVATSFPVEYGGQGLEPIYDAVVNRELADADAPPPPPIAHIAHAIADFASDALKARVLPGLLTCTEPWCQGFSEPGAGSDLADIRTTGQIDGDTIRINGQKIWTSGAMWAQWCLLFLRTEPDLPKHKGLSMVVVPMDSPGIVRRQIMLSTGSGEFAEVFFDNVEVPTANLIGERGQGWAIAMHMLAFERGPADMGWTGRYRRGLEAAKTDLADDAGPARTRLTAAQVGLDVLEWHVTRSLANRADSPGTAGSVDKLLATRVEQDLYRVAADIAGPDALLNDAEEFLAYLHSRAQSIYGGSQQIQRNIVGEKVLGLPR
ncbi:acyl-CoA dehydrogenase family protein [Microbacterium sp. A84]|uniref:acyl-CoA dehydrogenase family protein n=1 Tax=Microbacterium sp. A84 TaxID=3450715 RepID=UPI003F43700F